MFTDNDVSFSHDVSRVKMGQRKKMSCWYSAYRMLYSWNISTNDSDVKENLEKSSLDFDECMRKGLNHSKFKQAQDALFLYGQPGVNIRRMSLGELQQMIRKKGPIWSATLYEGSNHIVLLTGYYKKVDELIIYNPYNPYAEGSARPDAHVERRSFRWYKDYLHGVPSAMQYWKGP